MDLHILSEQDALEFLPAKPTYAIRIFSSWTDEEKIRPLQNSKLYLKIRKYVFDDNDNVELGPIWFDRDLAKKVLNDFKGFKNLTEALLVHCSEGENRAPAVAMALNEIFNLGQNADELRERYGGFNGYNRRVYNTLKELAK